MHSKKGTATSRPKVLIADDDPTIRRLLARHVPRIGVDTIEASDGEEAIELVKEQGDALVAAVLDLQMPHANGLQCLEFIKERYPEMSVMFLSSEGEIEDAVAAMKAGAFDYLTKPFSPDELCAALQKAISATRLRNENSQLRAAVGVSKPRSEFLGNSPVTKKLLADIKRIAAIDSTVLITGESGVGKSFLARQIHYASARSESPFVTVSCPALPRELLESEMFGHEKGAFTGAHQQRTGKFEIADGGTMFLDEVGDMPIDLQPKLLSVLQDREFTRIGGLESIPANVRLIAATNVDLPAMIRDKAFREDLYYRLNVIPLCLPPLRERIEDVCTMTTHFLHRIARDRGIDPVRISDEAMEAMLACKWPGNVRQLENTLERASAFCIDGVIQVSDLPREVLSSGSSDLQKMTPLPSEPSGDTLNFATMTLSELEKVAIAQTLSRCGNNKAESARSLGISEKSIYNKMKKHGMR